MSASSRHRSNLTLTTMLARFRRATRPGLIAVAVTGNVVRRVENVRGIDTLPIRWRHLPGLARLAVAAAAFVLLVASVHVGQAQAVSAIPYKSAGDSGQISSSDLMKGNITATISSCDAPDNSTCYATNPQACVWTDSFNNFSSSFQQWNVPGCVLQVTPWIKMGGLSSPGWALYCPPSAPYNWSYDGFGQISAIQQWTTSTHTGYVQPASGNSEQGKIDYYATNLSPETNYWRYYAGCGNQAVGDGHGGGKYCCGQGTKSLGADRVLFTAGPPRRTIRPQRGVQETTYEFAAQPNSTRTRRYSCAAGYRRTLARSAVGFTSVRPPSARTKRDVSISYRLLGARGYAVTIKTRRIPRNTAQVQVTLRCVRPGVKDAAAVRGAGSHLPSDAPQSSRATSRGVALRAHGERWPLIARAAVAYPS